MSTKIYNGIKFKSKDITKIISQLRDLRFEAEQMAHDHLVKWLPPFVRHNDRRYTYDSYLEYLKSVDVWDLERDIRTDNEVSYSKEVFLIHYTFSVMLYPYKTWKGITWYGYYLDSYVKGYQSLIEKISTDFHYQNQSDQPENVSDKEWDFRRKVWDALLPGIGILNDTGMKFKIVDAYSISLRPVLRKIIKAELCDIHIKARDVHRYLEVS